MDKPCYSCHDVKDTSDMEEIGMWICKACLAKAETKKKKK
tara:strand:+ start:514 stop:633 length:120 start_codon:yes stop_codon:yes gene_type:complete